MPVVPYLTAPYGILLASYGTPCGNTHSILLAPDSTPVYLLLWHPTTSYWQPTGSHGILCYPTPVCIVIPRVLRDCFYPAHVAVAVGSAKVNGGRHNVCAEQLGLSLDFRPLRRSLHRCQARLRMAKGNIVHKQPSMRRWSGGFEGQRQQVGRVGFESRQRLSCVNPLTSANNKQCPHHCSCSSSDYCAVNTPTTKPCDISTATATTVLKIGGKVERKPFVAFGKKISTGIHRGVRAACHY